MQHITSRKNPIVTRFRQVARADATDHVLLDGAHLVAEALDTGIPVPDAVVALQARNRPDVRRLVSRLMERGTSVLSASAAVMEAISQVRSASSIVAIAERPTHAAPRVYGGDTPLVVIAADVQDPGNVGAIVRIAEAGGATGVVFAGSTAYPWSWKALRGSMGSALRLPVVTDRTVVQAVAEARRHGCRIVASVPRGGQPHFDADLRGSVAIVIGGEGAGVSADIVETADLRVTIPMKESVESLNAAVSAALLVYEANRQRRQPETRELHELRS